MKILRIESGTYDIVYTDVKPEGSGVYRRNFTGAWEHSISRNGGTWLRIFDHTQLEEAYKKYMKEQPNG